MNDKIIWVFREKRSGSSWFTVKLSNHLKRQFWFFDDILSKKHMDFDQRLEYFLQRKQEQEDTQKILNTHHLFALKSIQNYKDPILVRVTRKDKAEHFCSEWISQHIVGRFYNVHNEEESNKYPKIKPIEIPYKHIFEYIDNVKKHEDYWNTYASGHVHETVTYEQLLDSYSSDILPITNWSMQVHEEGLSIKLPYDKREVITNYDVVKNIINDRLGL